MRVGNNKIRFLEIILKVMGIILKFKNFYFETPNYFHVRRSFETTLSLAFKVVGNICLNHPKKKYAAGFRELKWWLLLRKCKGDDKTVRKIRRRENMLLTLNGGDNMQNISKISSMPYSFLRAIYWQFNPNKYLVVLVNCKVFF